MKNLFNTFLLSLFVSFSLLSCSPDDLIENMEEPETFNFEISMPVDLRTRADGTRSYGDGTAISGLKYYVYAQKDGNYASPYLSGSVSLNTVDDKRTGKLSVQLPIVGKYDFVFVSTVGNAEDANGKIYYNKTNRTLNVNYSKISTNDEDVDCFFAVLKDVNQEKGYTHTVTLKRPMAQLNIGTKDLDDYNTLSSSAMKSLGITVDGVYSSMKVMDGSVTGSASKISFPASSLPVGQTFPVADCSYLSMNYLLVNERKNVDVTLTVSNSTSSFISEIKAVPIQRNHQTNIYGNLLTKENDFKVEIKSDFGGIEDSEIDTAPKVYDLILKVSTKNHIYLNCNKPENKYSMVSLDKYKDSEGYIKVRWSDLNMADAIGINFKAQTSLQEVIKCDISSLNINDVSNLFNGCISLKNIEALSEWDTSKITDMSHMFENCGIHEFDLSNFDTTNVKNMESMFSMTGISSIDLSNFDTSNVESMKEMFYHCESLTSVNMGSNDNENLKDISGMFRSCDALATLDLTGFGTSNVNDMSFMFFECISLESLNISDFNTSNVTDMSFMFQRCTSLKSLDLTNFDTSNVTDMSNMFAASGLSSLDVSSFNTSKVTDMGSMFSNCKSLRELDLSNFRTPEVTDMSDMFYMSNIVQLDVSNFNTEKVTTMSQMFLDCKVSRLDLSSFNTPSLTDMKWMFYGCSNMKSLEVPNFDTSLVTNMSSIFWNCTNLEVLDLSSFDTSNVTTMYQMFSGCKSLKSLDIHNFNTEKVTDMSDMFHYCAISSIDLSSFNTCNVNNMTSMFDGCSKLVTIDLTSFDTSNVTDMSDMFRNCKFLQSLDLHSFDTEKVTGMSFMFYNCERLNNIDVSSFNTSNVTSMKRMFAECSSLRSLDISNFDLTNTDTYCMFENCIANVTMPN